jgi:hypothetical protein
VRPLRPELDGQDVEASSREGGSATLDERLIGKCKDFPPPIAAILVMIVIVQSPFFTVLVAPHI